MARLTTKVWVKVELIAIALPRLCKFIRILLRVYSLCPSDAPTAIRAHLSAIFFPQG
jgi:hypothetical protein